MDRLLFLVKGVFLAGELLDFRKESRIPREKTKAFLLRDCLRLGRAAQIFGSTTASRKHVNSPLGTHWLTDSSPDSN